MKVGDSPGYSQPSCPGGPVVGTDRWDAAGSGRPACPPALWRPLTPAGRAQVAPHSLRTHSRMVLSAAGARRRSRRRSSEPPHSLGPLLPSASKYHSKKNCRRSPPPRYHSPRGTPTLPAKVQGGVVGGDHLAGQRSKVGCGPGTLRSHLAGYHDKVPSGRPTFPVQGAFTTSPGPSVPSPSPSRTSESRRE